MALDSSKSVPSPRQSKSVDSTRSSTNSSSTKSTASSRRQSVQLNQPNKQAAKKKKKKKKKESEQDSSSAQVQEPTRRFVKPENQLDLTEKELEEEISRILTGDDPNKPKNVCKFSYKDKCFKPDPPGRGDNMAVHFSLEGCSMHVDSDECKKYRKKCQEREEDQQEEADNANVSAERQASTATISAGTSMASMTTSAGDHRRNQFDFSERASQTFNNPPKSRGVHTEPPPITQYQDDVSQWMIHDSYKSEYILIQTMEGQEGRVNAGITFEDKMATIVLGDADSGNQNRSDTIHSKDMENALKTMERLVNQNAEDEVFQDFKYFEDRADQFRSSSEGTLLPLWRFSADRTSKKQVTSLCWSPRYNDMFAAGYGSYDFMRQGFGAVCCFSLKNTSHPEYVISTESGVMCLDFHPRYPSLLAVGCYDGTVLAYDISNGTSKPIYSSSLRSGKHSDPVWQVCWHDDGGCSSNQANQLNFYSVSSDGRVANWAMNKNELKMEPIMHLKLISRAEDDADEFILSSHAGGCCFNFNAKLDNLFLVGTEEGHIHLCSKAYSGRYIRTYDGHHTGVHAVRWNPFHESIFISCSDDWTVKLWHHERSGCVLHFDLGNSVGDVCWSPHSSTVFAAVTTDGRVHVFDLARNKREPLCTQKVVKRARLTKAAFNARDFVLIVGDDRGGVHSLKLSPNLRKLDVAGAEGGGTEEDKEEEVDDDVVQHSKMTRLLRSLF